MANPEPFEVPLEMRAYAATTVDQARKAFADFVATAQRTVADIGSRSEAAQDDAGAFGRHVLGVAEDHVAAAFALAERLVQARTIEEVTALQSAFLAERMAVFRAPADAPAAAEKAVDEAG